MADLTISSGTANDGSALATSGGTAGTGKTYTQEQLDAMFGDVRKQARSTTIADLLKEFGVEKAEDIKAAMADAKALREEKLNDAQKAQAEVARLSKEAADAKREKEDALKLATRRLMRAQVVAEASKTFDDAEFVSVWNALNADAKLMEKIKVEEDGETFTGIDATLVEIAKQHPRWLKSSSNGKGTPNSDGSKRAVQLDESHKAAAQQQVGRYYQNIF